MISKRRGMANIVTGGYRYTAHGRLICDRQDGLGIEKGKQ